MKTLASVYQSPACLNKANIMKQRWLLKFDGLICTKKSTHHIFKRFMPNILRYSQLKVNVNSSVSSLLSAQGPCQ